MLRRLFNKWSLLVLSLTAVCIGFQAHASGVNVTLTPSSSSNANVSTFVDMQWQPSGLYATGTVLQVDLSPGFSSVDFLVGSTTNIGNGGVAQVTATSVTQVLLTVVTSTNSFAASSSLAVPVTFDATPQNYSFSILTSSSTDPSTPTDFGSALFYANGGNQVTVTAAVPATLSFAIRTADDTANTNSCALGVLSTAATSTCSYRLRISTNAAGGFTASLLANHDLATGDATMTDVTNGGSANAGTEGYGISDFQGASSGGHNVSTGLFDQPVATGTDAGFDFDTLPTPVPTSTAQTIESYSNSFDAGASPSLTTTSLVTHFANIDGGTAAGNYSQIVTYTVTASY